MALCGGGGLHLLTPNEIGLVGWVGFGVQAPCQQEFEAFGAFSSDRVTVSRA